MAARSGRNKMRYNLHRVKTLIDQIQRQLQQIDELSEGADYEGKETLPTVVRMFSDMHDLVDAWRERM